MLENEVTALEIESYILENFNDIYPLNTWGEKSFFLNPGCKLKRGTYFATLKDKDGDNDKASFLDRKGIFRLNIGLTPELYLSLFGKAPKRPAKGCCIEGDYDFQKTNTILPHPIYGSIGWACVLNPTIDVFEECKILLDNAYNKAQAITIKKLKKINY